MLNLSIVFTFSSSVASLYLQYLYVCLLDRQLSSSICKFVCLFVCLFFCRCLIKKQVFTNHLRVLILLQNVTSQLCFVFAFFSNCVSYSHFLGGWGWGWGVSGLPPSCRRVGLSWKICFPFLLSQLSFPFPTAAITL